jgi:hypothetical protein
MSMSAPGPPGCAENGDYTERGKDRAENSVIHSPGDGCAEQRQGGEQNKATYSRFTLASSKVVPIRKGQRPSRPFPLAQYEKTQLSGSARLVTLPRSVHRQTFTQA